MKQTQRTRQFLIGIGVDEDKLETFGRRSVRIPQRICENCKKKYSPKYHTQKYCDEDCRHKKKIQKYKKKRREEDSIKGKCCKCEKEAVGFINKKRYCKEHYAIKRKEIKENAK